MQIRKANYSKFSSFSFISFLLIFLFLFQACKKVDISDSFASTTYNPTTNSEQTKSFFIIPANSPDALKIIAKEMQQQFKENDVQDFLNWHGLPLWSKVIKFEKDKNGSITYAIPTQKDGEVTGFFAATIDKSNKIKLEMHRESAVFAKMEEYSYANININKTKVLLNYFSGITDVTAKAKKSETNNNLWDCLWYWVATTSLNLNNKKDSGTQNFRDGGYGNGYWLIVCMNIPDPPGGGGGTGGGSSGGSNNCDIYEEEFANNWWSNEPSSISAYDLENMVNRLAGYLLLNAPQIEWLIGHPDRVLEIDRFIGDGNDSQKNQLARDHLEEMLVDIPYLTFVHNHGQTGDPYKMWWEDEPWLNNPNNFNLDITRASNQIYELNEAEKA